MNVGETIFYILLLVVCCGYSYANWARDNKRFNEIEESIAWIGATMELKDKSDKLLIEKLENAYNGLVAHEARIQELEKELKHLKEKEKRKR